MSSQKVFAVRGATTVENDNEDEVITATTELLNFLISKNELDNEDDIINAFFTATKDLTSCFPAKAARNLGWTNTPLMCSQEIDVKDGLEKCIRIMITYYADSKFHQPQPVYLKKAKSLRPDIQQ